MSACNAGRRALIPIFDGAPEKEFGDLPLAALTERGCRGLFMGWRDRIALRSRRQADYAWVVLARVLSSSLNRGLVVNPCERGGRLYRGSRADKVWTLDDELVFLERAPRHLHLPLTLARSGQARGNAICFACRGRLGIERQHQILPTAGLGFGSQRQVWRSTCRSARLLRPWTRRDLQRSTGNGCNAACSSRRG